MGRRSLLTPELREWLERELAAGCPQAVAAQRAGIGQRTLERWLAQGRVRRPEPPAPPEDDFWRIAASLLQQALTGALGQVGPTTASRPSDYPRPNRDFRRESGSLGRG